MDQYYTCEDGRKLRIIDQSAFEDEVLYGRREFDRAYLRNIVFPQWCQDLSKATFSESMLVDCHIERIDLTDSDFSGADLMSCVLRDTYLDGAALENTKITDTLLEGCGLTDTNMRHSEHKHSIFAHCKLSGADLSHAIIDRAIFESIDVGAGVFGVHTTQVLFVGATKIQKDAYIANVRAALYPVAAALEGPFAPDRLALIEAVQHVMQVPEQECLITAYGRRAGECVEKSNVSAQMLVEAYKESAKFMGISADSGIQSLTRRELYEKVRIRRKTVEAKQREYEQHNAVTVTLEALDAKHRRTGAERYRLVWRSPDSGKRETYPNCFTTFQTKEQAHIYMKIHGLAEAVVNVKAAPKPLIERMELARATAEQQRNEQPANTKSSVKKERRKER